MGMEHSRYISLLFGEGKAGAGRNTNDIDWMWRVVSWVQGLKYWPESRLPFVSI